MKQKIKPRPEVTAPILESEYCGGRPDQWPPQDDWPVVIDSQGNIISRWSDAEWNFDQWAGKRCRLAFGDELTSPKTISLDKENADLLRLVIGWWLWHDKTLRSARTIWTYFQIIKRIFTLCYRNGIVASQLQRFPKVVAQLRHVIRPTNRDRIISLLHDLNMNAEEIGFSILSNRDIARLRGDVADHFGSQTPYIPPRIWKYQISRLENCIDDFLENKEAFLELAKISSDIYSKSGKEGKGDMLGSKKKEHQICKSQQEKNDNETSSEISQAERFSIVATKLGLDIVLKKWVGLSKIGNDSYLSVRTLTRYLTLINWVCIAYIINFTLMRIEEAMGLRRNCFIVENDPRFGSFYLIVGKTSKTALGDGVYWVTSKSSRKAVESMTIVSGIRNRSKTTVLDDMLFQSPTDPWFQKNKKHGKVKNLNPLPYKEIVKRYPLLFDVEQLRVTESDYALARLITPSLKAEFQIGEIWNLAWHQLRRTGAVNMQASGLVSPSALQYQLKHEIQAMSLYYGKNYSRLRLDPSARDLYVDAMYESLAREMKSLASERFSSPHGGRRKEEMIRIISQADFDEGVKLAKQGGVSFRPIILGACMNPKPCPYGGVDSVIHCGGGDSEKPCSDVLYDREKMQKVSKLDELLDEVLSRTDADSTMHQALLAQKRSTANYFATLEALKGKK